MERVEEIDEKILNEPKINNPNMDLNIMVYEAVKRFKSVRRAQRRGHVTRYGTIAPKRPFNNRANTSSRKGIHSRSMNKYKKEIYGKLSTAV